MSIVLFALAVSFGAFCVWLTVRVVNRGWRPTRRSWIGALFILIVAYPLSFGPWLWIDWSFDVPHEIETVAYYVYWPCYDQHSHAAGWFVAYIEWFQTHALNCPWYLKR
ncbi:MAG: hypothetical protein HY290_24255 [Planctomycetia bacterium]|nr:hypothetical protein [Planctomycetia bacterium]